MRFDELAVRLGLSERGGPLWYAVSLNGLVFHSLFLSPSFLICAYVFVCLGWRGPGDIPIHLRVNRCTLVAPGYLLVTEGMFFFLPTLDTGQMSFGARFVV